MNDCICVGKWVHGYVSWYVSGYVRDGCSGMYVGLLMSGCMSMYLPPLTYNTLKIPRFYLGCRPTYYLLSVQLNMMLDAHKIPM